MKQHSYNLMNAQEKVYTALGLYVHVPFCAVPCDYCAFYKARPTRNNLNIYIRALLKEIDEITDDRAFDTIYFGGGTPGILSPEYIDIIAHAIHKKLKNIPKEWTVEIAPNSINAEKLKHWKNCGVNRISLGVQSFNPETLQSLGRKQTPQEVFHAYDLVRRSEFDNVGIDLIFSAPSQTKSQLIADLTQAVALAPEHISTYCLSYENNTPLRNYYGNNIDENRDHDFYENVCDFLENSNYEQYEISNFCIPERASLHNLNTWLMHEWIGIGPSASSQYGGRRYTHVASLDDWSGSVFSGHSNWIDVVRLNERTLAVDQIIFGLRMNAGVDLRGNILAQQALEFASTLVPENLISIDNASIKLTKRGKLLCDAIASEFFNILG